MGMSFAQIRVMFPAELMNKYKGGRIEGSTATFGAPFYGERILGRLVWGESLKGHKHCKEDDYNIPPPDEMPAGTSGTYNEVGLINIVMVRRGLCSFVTKVRVARAKGAHAVIIVDKENSVLTAKDISKLIIGNDGYGDDIDIPSILVSKADGGPLIEAASKMDQVVVELAWDVPTNHVVQMDLWMSSGSMETMLFLSEFAPKRRALNHAVSFVPHYHVFSMSSTKDYNDLCTDVHAQYCAEDPDGPGPITGAMVLAEDVRQLCIHELTKVARTENPKRAIVEYAEKFWDYVERLAEYCPLQSTDPAYQFGSECSHTLMKHVGIEVEEIDKCTVKTKEKKLHAERENKAWSPRALRINGWRYSGTLDAELVTRAICAGFVKKPDICQHIVTPANVFREVKTGGISVGVFFTVMLIVGFVILAAMFFYKRSLTKHMHTALREEVMLEVRSQMDAYRQLPA